MIGSHVSTRQGARSHSICFHNILRSVFCPFRCLFFHSAVLFRSLLCYCFLFVVQRFALWSASVPILCLFPGMPLVRCLEFCTTAGVFITGYLSKLDCLAGSRIFFSVTDLRDSPKQCIVSLCSYMTGKIRIVLLSLHICGAYSSRLI